MKKLLVATFVAVGLLLPLLAQAQNTISVISPELNADLGRGEVCTFTWKIEGPASNSPVMISLKNPFGYSGFTDDYLMLTTNGLTTNGIGSISWKVPTDQFRFPSGTCWLEVAPLSDFGQIEQKPFYFGIGSKIASK